MTRREGYESMDVKYIFFREHQSRLVARRDFPGILGERGEERAGARRGLEERKRERRISPEFLQSCPVWGTWTEKASRSGARRDWGLRTSLSQRRWWSSLVSEGPWINGTRRSFAPSDEPGRERAA